MSKIFILFLYTLLFVFSAPVYSAETQEEEKTRNFGIYGFYLGQTLSGVLENAIKKGYSVSVRYQEFENCDYAPICEKNDFIIRTVKDFQKRYSEYMSSKPNTKRAPKIELNPLIPIKLKSITSYSYPPIEILHNRYGNRVKFDYFIGLDNTDLINSYRQKGGALRDIPYNDVKSYLFYVEVSTENNVNFKIFFSCNILSNDEPKVWDIQVVFGKNEESAATLLEVAVKVLNQRYGNFVVEKNGTTKYWSYGSCYAQLYRNFLDFIDWEFCKSLFDYYKNIIEAPINRAKSNAVKEM